MHKLSLKNITVAVNDRGDFSILHMPESEQKKLDDLGWGHGGDYYDVEYLQFEEPHGFGVFVVDYHFWGYPATMFDDGDWGFGVDSVRVLAKFPEGNSLSLMRSIRRRARSE